MKRLLLVGAILLLCLTGCGKEEKPQEQSVVITPVSTFDVDMSHYQNMSSVNHHFKGITPETYFNLIRTNGNAIIYIGYDTCPVCNRAVSIMEEVADELDLVIYYIDCYHPLYPLVDYIEEFMDITDPVLLPNDEGEKAILTPHVLTLINGEFVESWVGIDGLDPEASEDDYQKVYDKYKSMMECFKVD